jgi:hypothetical protein
LKVMQFLSNKCVSMIIFNLAIKLRAEQALSRTPILSIRLTRNKSRTIDKSLTISHKTTFLMVTMKRISKMMLSLLKVRKCTS